MQRRPAFTLIEFLLVIGIIAVLAGIVISAINPRTQFLTAQNAKRQSVVREMQNAIAQYQIATGSLPDTKTLPNGAVNAISICRTTAENYCYDLSALVPTYLGALPTDPAEPSNVTTGFGLYQTGGNQVQAVALHMDASDAGAPTDYLARWPLQDSAASTTVTGAAGNGTLQGGDNTSTLSTTGPGGSLVRAIQLDGSADYISFNAISLGASTAFTLTAWIKRSSTSSIQQILGLSSDDSNIFRFDGNRLNVVNGLSSATVTTTTGVWYHVAVVRTVAGDFTLYQDAVNVTGAPSNSTAARSVDQIGRTQNGVLNRYLNGAVADVRIYNRALSAVEVAAVAANP